MNDTTAETRVERDDEQQPRSGTRTITGHLFRIRDGKGWGFSDQAPEPPPDPVYRPARVAQMLALAHRLEAAIAAGEYQGRADVARQLGFTRARITQLLDLTLLASDIQEAVLELEAIDGVEPLSERALREVLRHRAWADQRQAWAKLPRKSGAHATVA